jgi:hypothetical protein
VASVARLGEPCDHVDGLSALDTVEAVEDERQRILPGGFG